MKYPIDYVDIRVSAHATEDLERVERAVYNLFPAGRIEETELKRDVIKGHYGNPITLLETRMKDGEMIKAFVNRLTTGLSELDKEAVLREANLHIEKTSLYLRLDKQAAFEGELRLHKADPIHIRIHFRKRNVIEICRELGLTP